MIVNSNNVRNLLPCNGCEMYRFPTQQEIVWLQDHSKLGDDSSETITMTCPNCVERDGLKLYIEKLKSTIDYLNDRVTSLRNIRHSESIIDESIDHLTDQFKSIDISDTSNIMPIDSVAENVTIVDCTDATLLNTSNATSVWADTTDVFDEVLAGLQTKPKTVVTIPKVHTPDVNSINDSLHSSVADTLVVPREKHIDVLSHQESDHSNWHNNIELLVIGDESLAPFYVNNVPADSQNSENMFKVARPNALLGDLVETTKFFLDRFPKIKTVVFHGGSTVMKRGKTEVIKTMYRMLIEQLKCRNINLVLSGPFPNPCMSSETFSRTASINRWLNNLDDQEHLTIANNFGSFWNKPGMIFSNSYKLTSKGAAQLLTNIQSRLC